MQVTELRQEICFQVFADDVVNNLVAGNSVLQSSSRKEKIEGVQFPQLLFWSL